MRLTEFWNRMEERFGAAYAASLAADFQLPGIGLTIDDAITSGVETKEIWRAVCQAFDMPAHLI